MDAAASGEGQSIEILLVEDSPTDAELTREALEESKVKNVVYHVEDGVEAMAYLRREGKYIHARRPEMVLLDLNLPRKDGREVLAEIRSDPELQDLLVVVLTTSKDDQDIRAAYRHQANAYIVKPVDFGKFTEVVKTINHFWFDVVRPGERES